jgi:hypothetical protein
MGNVPIGIAIGIAVGDGIGGVFSAYQDKRSGQE